MTPLVLPLPTNPVWAHAREIVAALRAHKKSNPFICAALVNGFAESWWSATAVGDHGESFGPWQLKARFYRQPILDGTVIDICDPRTTLTQHCDAVLFALGMPANAKTLTALDAAETGADATRIWCAGFERASAESAVERRVAIAPKITVWLAELG